MSPLPKDHDPGDKMAALALALDSDVSHTGLYYQERRPTFGALIESMRPEPETDRLEKLIGRFLR